MFTRPQILSTPHFVSNMQDIGGLACNYGFSQTCPVSFSCSPYSGSCTDSTYVGGTMAIIGVVSAAASVAGIAIASLVWFQISGGEPFLWSHLAEAVKTIKRSGSSIVVITNGTVGTEDDYTAVIPWVDRFQFSIDGVSGETNDRHRGKGSFEKAMQHIQLAKTLGMKEIILSFTPSRHNIHDLPAMFQLTQDLDAVSLHVNRLMPIGRGVRSQPVLAASDEDYSAALDELMEKYQDYVRQKRAEHYANSLKVGYDAEEAFSHIIDLDISGDQSRKVITYACRTNCGTSNMLSVDPDGSVYS